METFDVVVVGAGSAGAAVARRPADDGALREWAGPELHPGDRELSEHKERTVVTMIGERCADMVREEIGS
ncbi:hypothetical protein [Nonomuraea sp. NPDC052265]|uniref:hypothetical protein n=1 Tax=Nonomuraea sp. NPDC052265 TaxID=3364374 RepID=UPI0037C78223